MPRHDDFDGHVFFIVGQAGITKSTTSQFISNYYTVRYDKHLKEFVGGTAWLGCVYALRR